MKRIAALIFVMAVVFCGCGNNAEKKDNATESSQNELFKKDSNFEYDGNNNIVLYKEADYFGFCDYYERLAFSIDGQYAGLKEQYFHKGQQVRDEISSYHTAKDNPDYMVKDYEDGIAIVNYLGDDKDVVLPDEIEGKPVVALCGYIEIAGEESDLYFYHYPFTDNDTASVTLPKSLKYIEKGSLYTDIDMHDNSLESTMEEIKVDNKNPYYSAEDGLLYNKGKTALLYVPDNYKKSTVSVPDGVTAVYSAYSQNTETVSLSKTVEKIEHISPFDFFKSSKSDWSDIGYHADYRLKAIEVDEKNKLFSSENGALYNKDKTELVAIPYAMRVKSFVVHDSVQTVDEISASSFRYINKLVFGKNIKEIKMDYDRGADNSLKTIAGYKGSAAEEFAEKNKLKFEAVG